MSTDPVFFNARPTPRKQRSVSRQSSVCQSSSSKNMYPDYTLSDTGFVFYLSSSGRHQGEMWREIESLEARDVVRTKTQFCLSSTQENVLVKSSSF
ncbi:hypothetical protein AVEN_97428-1 [Araneus ventricosus]|uniref:Uncharacterized protein n=1 Tax=Araneus ventricosus TaxID=182803 RepID=A0A4Y2EJ27_ARAVE|nr:hypothetical protein AVEN_97428-1 [Araneus ventricosus]